MFEKVNPYHPDKVADKIAGALVDLAYKKAKNPRVAVEVLIGHGVCHIIAETSVKLDKADVTSVVHRIAGNLIVDYVEVPQDGHLADNQADGVRCGDNGIFKGMPVTEEQKKLSQIARDIFSVYPYDGKYILDGERLIQPPFRKLLKAADRADVAPCDLHDFGVGSAIHGIVTDGTAKRHGLAGFLGFEESVDVDGYICLGQILTVQTAAGHRVSHIRTELAVGSTGVHIGTTRPVAERIDFRIGIQLSECIRRCIALTLV